MLCCGLHCALHLVLCTTSPAGITPALALLLSPAPLFCLSPFIVVMVSPNSVISFSARGKSDCTAAIGSWPRRSLGGFVRAFMLQCRNLRPCQAQRQPPIMLRMGMDNHAERILCMQCVRRVRRWSILAKISQHTLYRGVINHVRLQAFAASKYCHTYSTTYTPKFSQHRARISWYLPSTPHLHQTPLSIAMPSRNPLSNHISSESPPAAPHDRT